MNFKKKKAEAKKPVNPQVASGFADAFEAALAEQEIHFTTEVNDRGDAIFRIPYRTEASRRVTVLLQFDRAENVIRFYAFGYIQNTPPEREAAILEKLNDVNRRLLFYKFYLDDDRDIVLCWYFPYLTKEQMFSPVGLNLYILRALDVLDKLHGEFMEVVDGDAQEEPGMRRLDADTAQVAEAIVEVLSAVHTGEQDDAVGAGEADGADGADGVQDTRAQSTQGAWDAQNAENAQEARNPQGARKDGSAGMDAGAAADAGTEGVMGKSSASPEGAAEADLASMEDDAGAPRKEPPRLYVVKPRDPDA